MLETTLKHLLSLWKAIIHQVGILFIDKLMRNIVSWYDNRSPASANQIRRESEHLPNQHTDTMPNENECSELKSKLDNIKQENINLKRKVSQLNNILIAEKESNSILQQNIAELNRSNEALRRECDVLRHRCLPESEEPSMIFFAQGDATGLWLRKVSTNISTEHLYKLTTKPGDSSTCTFSPILHHNASDVIANRSITLLACEITSIANVPTSIHIVEEGMATREGNRWKIIHKAKIKLI